MKQKFIRIAGTKLAYLEKNVAQENTLFFIHGNSVSSRSWNAQLNSHLLKKYRLIAIDLPAHGDSEAAKAPAEAYSLPGLGAIVAEMVRSLAGDKPYLLTGLSLGTNILAEALAFELQPTGIVIAGSCLVGGKYTLDTFAYPETHVHVVFTEAAPEAEVRAYASEVMESPAGTAIEDFVADYYKVKPHFRANLIRSILQGQFSDQMALIAGVNTPVLMIFGKDEKIVNPDYLDDSPLKLWNKTIYKLPAAGHLVQLDQPEIFNQLLAGYAADCFAMPKQKTHN